MSVGRKEDGKETAMTALRDVLGSRFEDFERAQAVRPPIQ